MKALTVRQPYAEAIAAGDKTIEVRSRPTKHRGALAIHAAKSIASGYSREECEGLPLGSVVCVVEVIDCRPLSRADLGKARVSEGFRTQGKFAWVLESPRRVVPFATRGQLNLWNLPDDSIEYV